MYRRELGSPALLREFGAGVTRTLYGDGGDTAGVKPIAECSLSRAARRDIGSSQKVTSANVSGRTSLEIWVHVASRLISC